MTVESLPLLNRRIITRGVSVTQEEDYLKRIGHAYLIYRGLF